MDNLSELKEIWKTAKPVNLPNSAEMVRMIRKYRSVELLKIIGVILLVVIFTGTMVVIMFIYKSKMLSTRLGEVFIVMAGLILISVSLSSLMRFYKLKDESNKDFILFLERLRQKQLFYYKYTQIAGLAFCGSGLMLYLYEGVYQNRTWFIAGYTFLIAYLLFLWLFVRPKAFARQERKIKEKIEKFEALSKQLNDE